MFGCALESTEHERVTTAVIFTIEVRVRSQDIRVDGVFLRDERVQSPRPIGVAGGPSVLVDPLLDRQASRRIGVLHRLQVVTEVGAHLICYGRVGAGVETAGVKGVVGGR